MAIKILSKKTLINDSKEQEVLKEMNILTEIDHPNIIKVYDLLHDDENYFIITEFLYLFVNFFSYKIIMFFIFI